MKSPSSMRNGRFDTPKYRGKVQKMGALYTHLPKKLMPLQHERALKNPKKKGIQKKVKSKTPRMSVHVAARGPQAIAGHRSLWATVALLAIAN
jgi:hypothetical protein